MSGDIRSILAPLEGYRPIPWAQIPDFGLYMDQVVTFISRVYEPLYGAGLRGSLSPSMINNYVKSRLIPRPTGKKYSREQIALLLMIVALKQTCSMEDIRRMLTANDSASTQALYTAFCARFSHVLESMCTGAGSVEAPRSALDFAILAAGYTAGCAAVLKSEDDAVQ